MEMERGGWAASRTASWHLLPSLRPEGDKPSSPCPGPTRPRSDPSRGVIATEPGPCQGAGPQPRTMGTFTLLGHWANKVKWEKSPPIRRNLVHLPAGGSRGSAATLPRRSPVPSPRRDPCPTTRGCRALTVPPESPPRLYPFAIGRDREGVMDQVAARIHPVKPRHPSHDTAFSWNTLTPTDRPGRCVIPESALGASRGPFPSPLADSSSPATRSADSRARPGTPCGRVRDPPHHVNRLRPGVVPKVGDCSDEAASPDAS